MSQPTYPVPNTSENISLILPVADSDYFPPEPMCKICLSSENPESLVSPCKCSGSLAYVHQHCLKQWIYKRLDKPVYPGQFSQYNINCEICKTDYRFNSILQNYLSFSLPLEIALYLFLITTGLFASYFGFGFFLKSVNSQDLFTSYRQEEAPLENLLLNGFILTHIIIGIFYLIASFIKTGNSCSFFVLLCFNNGTVDRTSDDACCVCFALILFVSLLILTFCIYIDVIQQIIIKHEKKKLIIIEFLNYSNSSS